MIDKYENSIDLIYIDGDHRAHAVYEDAILSFRLCRLNGIIIFDDYHWGNNNNKDSTNIGIDKFLHEYIGLYQIIDKNYQVVIKKI